MSLGEKDGPLLCWSGLVVAAGSIPSVHVFKSGVYGQKFVSVATAIASAKKPSSRAYTQYVYLQLRSLWLSLSTFHRDKRLPVR